MKKRDVFLWLGLIYLALLVLFAIFGPWVRYSYDAVVANPYQPPSAQFWLGTDSQGKDELARLAYGARISLIIGLCVQAISICLGVFMGVTGVYARKWISVPVMRFTDGMFAFPDILLAILIVAVWEPGVVPVIVALAITAWPAYARLVYTQVATLKDREYVVAAKAMGGPTFYLVTRHVLSQLWGILFAVSMVEVAATILGESTLSFLGIGVKAPMPSWGNMISDARTAMAAHPIMLVWPCVLLSVTIFALNFVGDGLRSYFDPRSR